MDKDDQNPPKKFLDKRAVRVKTPKKREALEEQKTIIRGDIAVKVKTAKGRRLSSTRWLQRQLNDPYVLAAKEKGYRSRAAFKLLEIDEKFKFLKPNITVVDLGAAPGGWSQICATRTDSITGKGKVIAIDIQEMDDLLGVEFFHMDFTDERAAPLLIEATGGRADLVISDMAPYTVGVQSADHIRILNLVEAAIDFSKKILKPHGNFVSKIFEGGGSDELFADLKKHFKKVRYFKPESSRSDSTEIFVVATDFRGVSPE